MNQCCFHVRPLLYEFVAELYCIPIVSLLYTNICMLSVHTADNFTDAAVSNRINGEHKEKDLEPWEGGEPNNSDSLESLDTDVVGLSNNCAALDTVG